MSLQKGAKVVIYLSSFVQLCCGEERTLQTNITGVCVEWGGVGNFSQYLDHTGLAPAHSVVCFPGVHFSVSRFVCRGVVQSGP